MPTGGSRVTIKEIHDYESKSHYLIKAESFLKIYFYDNALLVLEEMTDALAYGTQEPSSDNRFHFHVRRILQKRDFLHRRHQETFGADRFLSGTLS